MLLLGRAAQGTAIAPEQAMVKMMRTGNYSVSDWFTFDVYGLTPDALEAALQPPDLARRAGMGAWLVVISIPGDNTGL